MEKDLEKYLKSLNSERCLKKPKEAVVILEKITNCFTNENSQFTLGILIGLLFDENDPVFTFIGKASTAFETLACVTAAFKLLEYLVGDFPKCTEPYYPLLYQKCLYLIDGKFAKVKELSLKLIKNVIEADSKQALDLSILISKLEKYLREERRIAGTVADQVYSLFGYLFEKYPETIKNEKWLLQKMVRSLRQESTVSKNPCLAVVRGAVEGLNGYLMNYPPPDADALKDTYECIKKWSKFREDKKAVSRTCLNILQNHWRHFSSFIYADKEFWRFNLEVWISQTGEDRQIAFKFLCSFYSVIALFTKQESNTSEVRGYVEEFGKCLGATTENAHQKRAALVGIKLFILTGCLAEADFVQTYQLVMDFIKKEEICKYLSCTPNAVECLSAFVLKFPDDSVQMEQLALLQRLSVRLMEKYPSFEAEFQTNALVALEKSFYMVGLSNSQTAASHIERIVYQGLIRTCSSMTLAELELLIEAGESPDSVCYKSFVGLWRYLLTLSNSTNLPVGGSFAVKKGVAGRVLDAFVSSFLRVVTKLDFSLGPGMEVEKPSDLHIFTNAVDLYVDLLPLVDPFSLQKWLTEVFRTAIRLSDGNPLLSGFYRITAANLKIADRVSFFEDPATEKCASVVRKYLEGVLAKVDHYKGDLQVACLNVLLSAPVGLMENLAERAVPALEIVTRLARSSVPLLKDLIETLERWDLYLPAAISEKILRRILPMLDIFFQSPYFRGRNSVDSSKGGKKLKVEVVFNDSEMLALQKKFLMFLGNLEIGKGLNLIELPDAEQRRKITDKRLVYPLPCGEGWVELGLDEMVLRVAALAESCGDRQTRVTACELLHSMAMVIVGNVNQLSGSHGYLFRKVARCCLTLACDPDGLVSQIFEPLNYQLVHYFSGKQAMHFTETEDLLEMLMDSVTCPYNPTVRDFAGDLLKEFTVWSIRQLSPAELKTTPEIAKRILERIYALALHPSYSKRLGAAVIFNRIYPVLREEDFILNSYWFQLFYHFVESLRMCEDSDDVTEIIEAIRHMERPLVEKRKEFNKDSPERVVPPEFEGGRLCHLVRWTMERACDLKPATRRTAMSLVQRLAPMVENCDSKMSFASKQLQSFFQVKGNSFQSDFDELEYTNWLKYQTAGFEYCTWLLRESVLTTEEVFQPKFKAVLKRFINGILSHGECKIDSQQEAILAFLILLHTLRERVCLYPPEHWDLLKMVMFKPSKFGFDLEHEPTSERLLSVLVDLLGYFSSHLTEYDLEAFYKGLDTVMTAPVFGSIASGSASVEGREFLFALRVVERSGMWAVFTRKVFFSMSEDFFLAPIFRSLFVSRGKAKCAVGLKPSCRLYLEEVLGMMLNASSDIKAVMKCLENEEEVREEESGKTVKKGEFFRSQFKDAIFRFLERRHEPLLEWALKRGGATGVQLLVQVLENQSGDSDLPLEIFVRWQDFENLKLGNAAQKNKLLLHLAVASARLVGTPGFLKMSPLAEKIYGILENRKLEDVDFAKVESFVSLFPFVSVFGEAVTDNDRLRACLSRIQVDVNLLKDPKDSFRKSRVVFALNGILRSLKTTASMVVLDFVASRAPWFNAVCKKEDVEDALSVFAESRTSVALSATALELLYDHCFKRETADLVPSVIFKLLLGPLLLLAPNPAAYQVVNNNLEDLCGLLSGYWGEEDSPIEILTNMTKKICAARMFQTFVTKLSKEELEQMPKERRQMMDGTVKNVFFFLKKPYPPRVLKDRYRKLMCEIFNMICSIVSARCVDEKLYKLFIFDNRGSFLFEAIDRTAAYNLDMDFEEIPKRKKHLTVLREAIDRPSFGRDSVRYIQTNTLFTSSLQEEATRFDLTQSFIRPMHSVPEKSKNVKIELEMDSLNSHECMATLVATISKMVRDKITPIDDFAELPCWLRFFLSVLRNSDLPENLRLFVLKAIYNVQEFVTAFCRQIFPDLLDAILKLFVNYPINYFLMDLIEMMVGWKHVPREERTCLQLTELFEIVLEKSDSLRRDIVKHNLEILKLMVEAWKTGMHLQQLSVSVFKRLAKSVEEDLRREGNADSVTYLNAHTCGILLSNGIPPWGEGREGEFFDVILKGFRDEYKHNQLFGEVCGQALNHVARSKPQVLDKYEQAVRNRIELRHGCWLQLLYGVHKHHPRMSSLFTFRIFSSAWDSMDSLTVKKLEMLLSHVSGTEAAEDATFDRHATAFILDMLSSPDAEVQEFSLRIAEKLLHKLDKEKLRVVLKEVVRLQRSVHPGVRKWVYEIGKKLYEKAPNDVFPDCKLILLRGLSDGVPELEESCLEFWRKVLNSTSPEIALSMALSDMYSSDAEDVFLSNAARMLLRLADDDYNRRRELFPHPVVQRCRFRKRNLVQGARQSFLLSLASPGKSLANQSLENVATIRHQTFTYLRPTIGTLKFQPTVQDDVVPAGDDASAARETRVPTNPLKRRFYKNQAKTSFSFARLQKKREAIGGKVPEVEILGEYRDGDYPDIQIRHSQISRQLEALSRRDPQIARLFLVSFYSGLARSIGSERRKTLFANTKRHLENIMKSSGNFDPGVFGFVLEVILNHTRDLDADFQSVSNAAVSSNWISLGALILEKIIANKEEAGDDDEDAKKKRKGCQRPEERRWLELARLYRSLEEFDVVSGIFLDKLNVLGSAKDAVRCESVSDWDGASKHYELALRSSSESSQTEFYTESYLSCLAKLSSWSSLNKCIRTTVNNDLGELWNNYYLLSWFLKSEIMISLGTERDEFRTILENFSKNSVKRDILAANFGEEMTVFDWFSDNLQRANHRIDKLCLDFLAGWSHLDQWSYNLRASKLMALQTLSELSFAVGNLSEASKSQVEENLRAGVKRWEKNVPAARDDLTVWDVKLGYRREFLKRLKDPELTESEVRANLALAKAALSQANLNLTKGCLSRAKEKLPNRNFDLKAEHHICFNTGKMVVAKMKMKEPNVGLDVFLNVWNGISKQISTAMETDSESSNMLLYSSNFILGQLVAEILPFVKDQTVPTETLCEKLNCETPNALEEKGLSHLETAVAALEKANGSSDTKSTAYLELSKFLLKFPGPFEKLCLYLFRSMRLGNADARELFGCLLNASHVPEDESRLQDALVECKLVPSWMFLAWINQMLARVNTKLYPLLRPLLLRITQDYPNAIRYPLKLTDEVKGQCSKVKSFLHRLITIVSKERIYDDFCNALRYLAPPDAILDHHLRDVLAEAERTDPDNVKIFQEIVNLERMMFSRENARFRGPVFKYWEPFEAFLADLLTEVENHEVLKRKLKNMLSSIEGGSLPSKRALRLLESYSPWLHDFHALKMDVSLELPGQYDGSRQPIEKYLVTVSSFRNSVLLFDSKCRPMRITVLGNDAKEHKFLIKFGEDLRQDERIQQVFRHFNHRLGESRQSRRLCLDTYGVVPLTPSLGMIEWVDDTASLHEMIENNLGDDSDAILKAQTAHLAFLSQGSPLAVPGSVRGTIAAHLIAFGSVKRESAISNFRKTVRQFPEDLLKRSFLDLSTSPEHFVHLRGNFATSHAVTCITHWLVGIGDRHLQNTLVSTRTGRVLGIDFGHAFGFATQFLTPPELLPFRLSPQIQNVMHPLGESGWIKQTMIHCLRVFRKESFRLRAVLEVFVEEPVMNWLKQVKKNPKYAAESDAWYPREKLALVERKLNGANPVAAFQADLLAGHSDSKYLDMYLEVLNGVPRDNIRARCGEGGLTEEEQVECLIDLATDHHVLAKTYIGWNPWL